MGKESFLKRLKQTIIDIKGVYKDCEKYNAISIRGNKDFIYKTKLALDLLQEKSPDAFNLIKGSLKDIIMGSHSYAGVDYSTCVIGNAYMAPLIIYASTLAHEAYHIELYRKFKKDNPSIRKVPPEVYGGAIGEKKALDYEVGVLRQLGADEATIEKCSKLYDTKWWEE